MTDKKADDTSMSSKVDAAFRQAAAKVVQRAKQTGTPVILWEDGRVKEVPPEQVELTTREAKSDDSESDE
jgi:hypothetical protein